jgi:hypothetical protein
LIVKHCTQSGLVAAGKYIGDHHMKKIIAGSVGALLMSAGLVASAGTAAQADPYPGTVATTTNVTAPTLVQRRHKANVCATVAVRTGNATPIGTVTITVKRNAGKFAQTASFAYSGSQVCLTTRKLKKTGGYSVNAQYTSKAGTVFNDSAGTAGFDVIKRSK